MQVRDYKACARRALGKGYAKLFGSMMIQLAAVIVLAVLLTAVWTLGFAGALTLRAPSEMLRESGLALRSMGPLAMITGAVSFAGILLGGLWLLYLLSLGGIKLQFAVCRGEANGMKPQFYAFGKGAHPFRCLIASLLSTLIIWGLNFVYEAGAFFGEGFFSVLRLPIAAEILLLVLWSALYLVVNCYVVYGLLFAPLILVDAPETGLLSAIRQSWRLAKGKRLQLFWLDTFSFLPWKLLAVVTLGLAALYVWPYIGCTRVVMYLHLKGNANFRGKDESGGRYGADDGAWFGQEHADGRSEYADAGRRDEGKQDADADADTAKRWYGGARRENEVLDLREETGEIPAQTGTHAKDQNHAEKPEMHSAEKENRREARGAADSPNAAAHPTGDAKTQTGEAPRVSFEEAFRTYVPGAAASEENQAADIQIKEIKKEIKAEGIEAPHLTADSKAQTGETPRVSFEEAFRTYVPGAAASNVRTDGKADVAGAEGAEAKGTDAAYRECAESKGTDAECPEGKNTPQVYEEKQDQSTAEDTTGTAAEEETV